MTDNASRVCGDGFGWRFSDLKFLIDIDPADLSSHGHAVRGREPSPTWAVKREYPEYTPYRDKIRQS